MAGPGHNASAQLKSLVERIERLTEEKKAIADDIRDVYAEAKGNGYDVKALRAIIKMRKQDEQERREHEAIVETYAHALGMLADTPLGQSAIQRATTSTGATVAALQAMRRVRGRSQQVDLEEAIAGNPALSPEPHTSVADPPFHAPAEAP